MTLNPLDPDYDPDEDPLVKQFGPYPAPGIRKVAQTRLTVKAAGGAVGDEVLVHRAREINFRTDPEKLQAARKTPIGPLHTQGCGHPGVEVALHNPEFDDESPNKPKPNLITRGGEAVHACIYCDGVALMPKFEPKAPPSSHDTGWR